MPAFDPDARNDHRLDAIADSVASDDFQIHDSYYDHTDAEHDIHCSFPLDRLRELAAGVPVIGLPLAVQRLLTPRVNRAGHMMSRMCFDTAFLIKPVPAAL